MFDIQFIITETNFVANATDKSDTKFSNSEFLIALTFFGIPTLVVIWFCGSAILNLFGSTFNKPDYVIGNTEVKFRCDGEPQVHQFNNGLGIKCVSSGAIWNSKVDLVVPLNKTVACADFVLNEQGNSQSTKMVKKGPNQYSCNYK
jgi:hypothetical protein